MMVAPTERSIFKMLGRYEVKPDMLTVAGLHAWMTFKAQVGVRKKGMIGPWFVVHDTKQAQMLHAPFDTQVEKEAVFWAMRALLETMTDIVAYSMAHEVWAAPPVTSVDAALAVAPSKHPKRIDAVNIQTISRDGNYVAVLLEKKPNRTLVPYREYGNDSGHVSKAPGMGLIWNLFAPPIYPEDLPTKDTVRH